MEKELDIIIPLQLNELYYQNTIDTIIIQNERYGFKRFALVAPSIGFRCKGFPSLERYKAFANAFCEVRRAVSDRNVSLGWWNSITLKSGKNENFSPVIKDDGSAHPFANCPLDKNFQKAISESVALFVKIAKPDFVTFEDDYSISAAAGSFGCFCPLHLAEFNRREGKEYTREQLLEIFLQKDKNSLELLRRYRELSLDSMLELSNAIRKEVNKVSLNTQIMLLESGSTDFDGGSTIEVAKALAGNNTAASRLHGTFYLGGETKSIPTVLYHAIYIKEHAPKDFLPYHETDTYPHTRFYSSAKQMKAMMSTVFSSGFVGSIFQAVQCTVNDLDNAWEETAYSQMFADERVRFNEIYKKSSLCERVGVELPYNTFYNALGWTIDTPLWTRAVSIFGVPFTTKPASIAFLDEYTTEYASDEEIMRYLSGTVFLDGDATLSLCKRGYGKHLGVSIGEDVTKGNTLQYDLSAYEKILPPFDKLSQGQNMPIAHAYACGRNGKLLKLSIIDDKCQAVSNAYAFENEFITTATTYFENQLGGKVFVMGMTLKNNVSQSLYNYRRKRLINGLLVKCGCDFPIAKDSPNVHLVFNKVKDGAVADFKYMLTAINLGDDTVEKLSLYIPKNMEGLSPYYLKMDGSWEKADFTLSPGRADFNYPLECCESLYLLFK